MFLPSSQSQKNTSKKLKRRREEFFLNMTKNVQKNKLKNPKPKTKTFFHCRCKDLLNLLRVGTALYHNRWWRYSHAKTCRNCWILAL